MVSSALKVKGVALRGRFVAVVAGGRSGGARMPVAAQSSNEMGSVEGRIEGAFAPAAGRRAGREPIERSEEMAAGSLVLLDDSPTLSGWKREESLSDTSLSDIARVEEGGAEGGIAPHDVSRPSGAMGIRLHRASHLAFIAVHAARELLRRDGLIVFLAKTRRVLWHEGWGGVKTRLLRRSIPAQQDRRRALRQRSAASPAPRETIGTGETLGVPVSVQTAPSPFVYAYRQPKRPDDFEAALRALSALPLFSIILPWRSARAIPLAETIRSVRSQWYARWRLIVVGDAPLAPDLQRGWGRDPRLSVVTVADGASLSAMLDAASAQADGEFILLLEQGDELTEDCLYELAVSIDQTEPDYLYSDEDRAIPNGGFVQPHFKPDWSPDTLMSCMYVGRLACLRRSLWRELGGVRSGYDGCEMWDLILRLTERSHRVAHVAKVLYHRRLFPDVGNLDHVPARGGTEAARRIREEALARRGLDGCVEDVPQMPGRFRVCYRMRGNPLISIIIPTRDNERVLRRCVDSILANSLYRGFELIVIDNGSVVPSTLAYLDKLRLEGTAMVMRHDAPFNFSALNNLGVARALGDILLFLNDDTEVLSGDWLERMAGYAQLPHVGAVGAKLLYPRGNRIQHAGILNTRSGPAHAFQGEDGDNPGYFARNLLDCDWLAVTGACMMVMHERFIDIGAFDESLPVAYNDIDLCLRFYEAGLYNVVCQAVRLIHHESASRGLDCVDPRKASRLKRDLARLYELHPRYFQHDPFHNKNLYSSRSNFYLPQ
jgi:O-antigen biosynthesis protein